jgi:flagellar protein FliS
MNRNSAADTYKAASVETAPPLKIVRMLYEGALRFLSRAEKAGYETSEGRAWVGRSDAIIKELRYSLDPNQNLEICEQLEALYLFCEDELARALGEMDETGFANAREILEILKDAWLKVGSSRTQVGESAA